jgi:voltage-gated potassium channel
MAFRSTGSRLWEYLEMPPDGEALSVPEALLARLKLSWLPASVAVGVVPYLLFLVVAMIDGTAAHFRLSDWWYSLVFPVVITYQLLLQPVMKRLLHQTVHALHSLAPGENECFKDYAHKACSLNPRREWLSIAVGVGLSWLIFLLGPPEARPLPPAVIVLELFGRTLLFGLFGWSLYTMLTRTVFLSKLHSQTQHILGHQSVPLEPIFRWGQGVALAMLGLFALIALFGRFFLNLRIVIPYGVLLIAVLLLFTFSREEGPLAPYFRLLRALTLFIIAVIIGTLGFNVVEGWSLEESFYATVITVTTIGYGDFSPTNGLGRLFTVFLSLFAIGIGGYAISAVTAFVVEGEFQRIFKGQKMHKQIAKLNQHIILCGVGHIGYQIAEEFHLTRTPFVAIEVAPQALEELLRLGEIPYVAGDATKDETLRLAGIERAKGLVTALSDDKDNVFVVLSARSLNPKLRIVARLTNAENAGKLRRAGADEIVSPNVIGGLRMASVMIRPSVVSFLDGMLRADQTLRVEELAAREITLSPQFAGPLQIKHIGAHTNLLVMAIKAQDGRYHYKPGGETVIAEHDLLIVIGTPEELTRAKGGR